MMDLIQQSIDELAECEKIIADGLQSFLDVGNAMAKVRDGKLYCQAGYATFAEYCDRRWELKPAYAYRLIQAAGVTQELTLSPTGDILPQTEWQVRPLTRLKAPDQRAAAWQNALDAATIEGVPVAARHVEQAVSALRDVSPPGEPEPLVLTAPPVKVHRPENAPQFNRTNDNVEWAWWTWNPVTGCKHDCPYCYARDIANRYYPEKFEPTFRPERLGAPRWTKLPAEAATNIGAKNVFVCSMADLFGKWVPQEWIEAVLAEVRNAPDWNFLFLTKFPQRLAEFDYPDNAWVGTSVDKQQRVGTAEKAFRRVRAGIKWLSCEPMLERLTFTSLAMFDWVVIGGASPSSKTPRFYPPIEWVFHLWKQAEVANCQVYLKTNLLDNSARILDYPGKEIS